MKGLKFFDQAATIASVNERIEKHGKDKKVPAQTIFVVINTSIDVLSYFGHDLIESFFRIPEKRATELDLNLNDYTEIRFPWMPPIAYPGELKNYRFVVHFGISEESYIVLDDVVVKNFTLRFLEGGRVVIKLQVNARPENENDQGRIARMIGQECRINLHQLKTPETVDMFPEPAAQLSQGEALTQIFGAPEEDEGDEDGEAA